MSQSVANIIDKNEISRFQMVAIIICISLNALDGFDVLAISFASPGIATDWGINRAALGVVLAMELVGMAIGSVALGGVADKFGRKPTIQTCLLLMTVGMFGSALASNITILLVCRFVTGIGIGGMLASTNAMVSEFANAKYRHLCVILMATGFPVGAVVGGAIASQLLTIYSWHSVFLFGAIVSCAFMVIVAFLLPESVMYLVNKGDRTALGKINSILAEMKIAPLSQLPKPTVLASKFSYANLFTPKLRKFTLLLVVAYFAQIMTFYFILKWIPKIVVDMGFAPSQAGQVLVWANVGGTAGAILLGLFTSKIDLRKLLIPVLIMGFVMVSVFGIGYESLSALAIISAATGFFTNSGVVGLYGLMAKVFPPEVRASGTGVVIGVGRGGAALSPIVAGLLFEQGIGLQGVAITLGSGAIVAAFAVYFLKERSAENAATNY